MSSAVERRWSVRAQYQRTLIYCSMSVKLDGRTRLIVGGRSNNWGVGRTEVEETVDVGLLTNALTEIQWCRAVETTIDLHQDAQVELDALRNPHQLKALSGFCSERFAELSGGLEDWPADDQKHWTVLSSSIGIVQMSCRSDSDGDVRPQSDVKSRRIHTEIGNGKTSGIQCKLMDQATATCNALSLNSLTIENVSNLKRNEKSFYWNVYLPNDVALHTPLSKYLTVIVMTLN